MEVLVNEEDTEWTNKHHQTFGAVDGRNPKQPSGMYKNVYIMGKTSLSIGWPDLLNHQQTVVFFFSCFTFSNHLHLSRGIIPCRNMSPSPQKIRSSKKGWKISTLPLRFSVLTSEHEQKVSPPKKSHRVWATAICRRMIYPPGN